MRLLINKTKNNTEMYKREYYLKVLEKRKSPWMLFFHETVRKSIHGDFRTIIIHIWTSHQTRNGGGGTQGALKLRSWSRYFLFLRVISSGKSPKYQFSRNWHVSGPGPPKLRMWGYYLRVLVFEIIFYKKILILIN